MDEQSVKNGTMGTKKEGKEREGKGQEENVWNHNVRRIFVAICSRGLIYTSEGFVRGGESNPCRGLFFLVRLLQKERTFGDGEEKRKRKERGMGGRSPDRGFTY